MKNERNETDRLAAYLQRLRGQAKLALGEPRDALTCLRPAETWYATREPWAHADVLVAIGNAQRGLGDPVAALAAHASALDLFGNLRDKVMARRAREELLTTLRATGGGRGRRLRRALEGRTDA